MLVAQVASDLMWLDSSVAYLSPTLRHRRAIWVVCLAGSAGVLGVCMILNMLIAARILVLVHWQDRH